MSLQCLWRDSVTLISTLLLTYLLGLRWAVVVDVWFGYELTWVRVGLGTRWYWVRVDLGTGWRWVRVDLGTSWLGTSWFGYELTGKHTLQTISGTQVSKTQLETTWCRSAGWDTRPSVRIHISRLEPLISPAAQPRQRRHLDVALIDDSFWRAKSMAPIYN